MTDQAFNQPPQIPEEQSATDMTGVSPNGEKREYSFIEKMLLPFALAIAILFDRLMFAPIFEDSDYLTRFSGVFWMCYLVIFYAVYWKKLMRNKVLWFVAGCGAALCAWSFFYTRNYNNFEFSALTYLVVPAVLMAHAQFTAGDYELKDAGKMAVGWLTGWIIKPFSGLPSFCGVIGSLFSGDGKSTAKKAALGVVITLPLLCIIIPLLSGADMVFGYYIRQVTGNWDFNSMIGHLIVVILALALFYSFLWNVGFGIRERDARKSIVQIDMVICCIVLCSVTLLYVLFCAVQFTYLFAGAGLPAGMTYSDYAREGFAQTVVVCAINLLIFGIFLQYGAGKKLVRGLLSGLLGLTGVMLLSGFVRLKLYIDAYGLTWLRILSAWFVIYLAVVLIICAVRMVREKMPAIALCAMILLGWYVALGYSNPDALVNRYNQTHNYDTIEMR